MSPAELAERVERQELAERVAAVVWDDYRKCPICRREIGHPCVSMSGAIHGGRPDGKLTPLPHPHVARKRRAGR